MKIQVTDDDIARGDRGSGCYCPVARAIKRLFPDKLVLVGPISITIIDSVKQIDADEYAVPVIASDAIVEFDKTGKMDPFEFELGEPVK